MSYNEKTVQWAREELNIGWNLSETFQFIDELGLRGPFYHAFKEQLAHSDNKSENAVADAVARGQMYQIQGKYITVNGKTYESKGHKYSQDDGQLFV